MARDLIRAKWPVKLTDKISEWKTDGIIFHQAIESFKDYSSRSNDMTKKDEPLLAAELGSGIILSLIHI